MERRILISIIILLVSAGFAAADDLPYKEGELLMRFADVGGQLPDQQKKIIILDSILPGCCLEREYNIVPGLSLVKLPSGTTVENALPLFNQSSAILYAEPDYINELAIIPNDTRFNELWGMHNTGQTGGTVDADIDAPEAWDIWTGSSEIIVAVTDTGVDYTHPDLVANMWVNPGEIPGNGLDDDGNGYVDDIYGYDWVNLDGDPMDDHMHGTHVSGTVGAVGNNAEGVAGVCWTVRIMALKCFDAFGSGIVAATIGAIEYATDMGANVINASWGGYLSSQALYDAIEAAQDAGILFVAAAHNYSMDNDVYPLYPASYDLDNIIAVLSTDDDDNMSGFSNYGATSVDLGAPGSDILSCLLGGGYTSISGTSMSTPHVAGACALIWSFLPGLSHMDVKNAILDATDPLVALDGLCVTGGRLNIETALQRLIRRVLNKDTGIIYRRIQDAIDDPSTLDGHELIADADNWYFETIDFLGKEITLRSGNVDNPGDVTISPENTYICCRGKNGSVVTFASGEGAGAVLKGFTITEGYATGTTWFENCGGGIYIENSSPTITDCIITGNRAYYDGGGIYCDNGSEPSITDCNISNNTAQDDGGAIACFSSSPLIKNCLIVNNSVDSWDGGGIYLDESSPEISNCTIAGNSSSEAAGLGGGICCTYLSAPVITDCILSDNSNHGIALWENGSAVPDINCCLFYNNDGYDYYEYEPDAGFNFGSSADPDGNFHKGPMFMRGRLGNYYLSQYDAGQILDPNGEVADPVSEATSPAVDAGSDTAANLGMHLYSTRTDNVADSGTVDIGYHYKDPLPAVQYQLYTTVIGNGSITPSGITSYPQYTQVPVEAKAGDNYQFKSWSGTDDDSRIEFDPGPPRRPEAIQHNIVTMNSNKSVTAVFETVMILLRTRVIAGVHGETGTIQPRKERRYRRGTVVNLYAEPGNPSYAIIWNGTDDDYSTLRSNTVSMIPPFTGPENDVKEVSVEFYMPETLHVPGDYTSIQRAINAAHDRDIIIVAPGTYLRDAARLQINNKAITLTSTNPDDPNVVAITILENGIEILNCGRNTIINGFFLDSIVYANPSGLNGDAFDFTDDGSNGSPCAGGGFRLHNYYWYPQPPAQGSSPDIRNCIIYNCGAIAGNGGDGVGAGDGGWGGWAHGGGASIGADSSPKFTNCQFIDCFAIGGNGGNSGPNGGRGGLYDQQELGYLGWYWGPYEDYRKYSGYGGAVYCDVNSTPEFVDCSFVGSVAAGGCSGTGMFGPGSHWKIDRFGGAVYVAAGSSSVFTNCVFEDSEADLEAPLVDQHDEATATDDPYIAYGGTVAMETGATPLFLDCEFDESLAHVGGCMYWEYASPEIGDCNFTSGTASYGGSILFVGGTAKIARCEFSDNHADINTPAGEGGAIACHGANGMIVDCDISNNSTNGSGGGVYISSKDISGGEVPGENTVLVKNCLITGNTASRDGAGISANWYSDPNIANCTIVDNIVTGDGFEHGYGGGVYCGYGNYTNIIDSIIWGNLAEIGRQIAIGTGYEYDPRPSTVNVSYSDVQDGAEGVYVDTGDPWTQADDSVLVWDYATNLTGTGAANPLFVSGRLGDYYLSQPYVIPIDPNQTVLSPCVNTGSDDAHSLDMYRHTTRTDGIIDGADPCDYPDAIVDMGYHYLLTSDLVGDFDYDGDVDTDDLTRFLMHWLDEGGAFPYWCHEKDLNKDGKVDNTDYAIFTKNYKKVETTPPIPNPMTWAIRPSSAPGQNWISMTATTAYDNSTGSDVEYYFECYSGGGHDSGWLSFKPNEAPTWNDTGLVIGKEYGYRVRARDGVEQIPDDGTGEPGNKTEWSVIAYVIAGVLEDITPPSPDPMTWATPAYTSTAYTITLFATTATDVSGVQYYFEDFNDPSHNSGWIDVPTWTDTGLVPNTTYRYRVRARDKSSNHNTTGWSELLYATTLAEGPPPPPPDTTPPLPNPSQWAPTATLWTGTGYPQQYSAVDPVTGLSNYWHRMEAVTAIDATPPVEYYFECYQGLGFDSGWQLSPIYDYQVGGAPVICKYRVKTRDAVGNEGQWSEVWPTQ